MSQGIDSGELLTDLHRAIVRALENVPLDTKLLTKSPMTVRQFKSDANALLGVVRGLQEAYYQQAPQPVVAGSKEDRLRRNGGSRRVSGSW